MQTTANRLPKVMHVLADVLPGGAEVLMADIIRRQHGRFDTVVVALEDHGEHNSLKPEFEKHARFHNLECRSFFSKKFRRKFKKILAEEKPDVLHAWGYDSGLAAGWIARYSHGIKVVWGIHSLGLPSRHEYNAFRFNALKALVGIGSRIIPHKIISCSDVATSSHVRFGYPRKKCLTIANGVDPARFKPSSSNGLRSELGIPADAQVVGYLGRCHPVKCIEDFFAMADELMRQRADLHCIALGFTEDDLYPEARRAFEKLSSPGRMHLLGSRADVENYLPAFTVNTLTSKSEAMPMVLMEALCSGVPCVATDVGSSREMLGDAGVCVAARDPQKFAQAVSGLLDKIQENPAAWRDTARQQGMAHFDIAVTEQAHSAVYTRLAQKSCQPRVVHLVNDLDFGGAQTILHRLASGLHKEGFEQTVVSVLPPGRLAPGFKASGIAVDTLGTRGLFSAVAGVFRLAGMIRREKPDILQTWMFHSALIGELASLLAFRRTKVLWSIHHTKLGKESSKMTTRIVQRTLAVLSSFAPERIIYCSKSSVDLHLDDGFSEEKAELIFNGTDENFYRADAEAKQTVRNEYGIPLDAPLIGMAGRYHPQKDFANLLRAFALVQKEIPEAHLLACGPDVTRGTDALRELADLCPSPGQVHLIGPRLDMQRVYPAFSIAALSSCEGEAFPLVLGEAMSCQVPCVATDVGDSALIIGHTGRIVQPRDAGALADAMIDLLGRDLVQLGKEARQRVVDHFTLDRYVEAHADLYRSMLTPAGKAEAIPLAAPVSEKPHPISH